MVVGHEQRLHAGMGIDPHMRTKFPGQRMHDGHLWLTASAGSVELPSGSMLAGQGKMLAC